MKERVANITLHMEETKVDTNEQVRAKAKMPTLQETISYQDNSQNRLYDEDDELFPTQYKLMQALKKIPTEIKDHRSNTLLHHHERMGHISFKKLRVMTKKGIIS